MKLYFIIIAAANIIIDFFNIFFGTDVWYAVILWTTLCTFAAFTIDLLLAILIRWLPENAFSPEKRIFTIFNFEKTFYEKMGIKKYKDRVPELGKFSGLSKRRIESPKSPEYVFRYMRECCYGEVIHFASVLIGFAAMFCCPAALWLSVGLPVVIVNALLCYLPFTVLRYNRKKLYAIYLMLKRKIAV